MRWSLKELIISDHNLLLWIQRYHQIVDVIWLCLCYFSSTLGVWFLSVKSRDNCLAFTFHFLIPGKEKVRHFKSHFCEKVYLLFAKDSFVTKHPFLSHCPETHDKNTPHWKVAGRRVCSFSSSSGKGKQKRKWLSRQLIIHLFLLTYGVPTVFEAQNYPHHYKAYIVVLWDRLLRKQVK